MTYLHFSLSKIALIILINSNLRRKTLRQLGRLILVRHLVPLVRVFLLHVSHKFHPIRQQLLQP